MIFAPLLLRNPGYAIDSCSWSDGLVINEAKPPYIADIK